MSDSENGGAGELWRSHLIETEELAERVSSGDDRLRIVDMRGSVQTRTIGPGVQEADYRGARSEYDLGHIPGAVYLDWTRDIADEEDPVPAQAAPAEKVERVLGAAGLGSEHEFVAYDAHAASQFATRFWWLMRYYGHDAVRVLNGGWLKWVREGRSVTAEPTRLPAALFTTYVRPSWRAVASEVAAWIGTEAAILDARDAEQYTGRVRRGSRGGHIPGALHVPREAFFASDSTFKQPAALADVLQHRGVPNDKPVVAYCNGGVAATSVLFALSMLGRDRLSNYDGSWNEWAERDDLPVEVSA